MSGLGPLTCGSTVNDILDLSRRRLFRVLRSGALPFAARWPAVYPAGMAQGGIPLRSLAAWSKGCGYTRWAD